MPSHAPLRTGAAAAALTLALFASPARAQSASTQPVPDASPPEAAEGSSTSGNEAAGPYFTVPSTRRSGFVFGVVGGLMVGSATGSPFKLTERGQVADTGTAVGNGGTFLLGGAFTDWFSFHVGATGGGYESSTLRAGGGGIVLGVEAWPLFDLGGVWRDLGVAGDFGTGAAVVEDKETGDVVAEGSGFSLIRGGVFWDAYRLWKFNFGPQLSYEVRSAETYEERIAWITGRAVFYGGP